MADRNIQFIDVLPNGDWSIRQFCGDVFLIDRTGNNEPRIVTEHGTEAIKTTVVDKREYFFAERLWCNG